MKARKKEILGSENESESESEEKRSKPEPNKPKGILKTYQRKFKYSPERNKKNWEAKIAAFGLPFVWIENNIFQCTICKKSLKYHRFQDLHDHLPTIKHRNALTRMNPIQPPARDQAAPVNENQLAPDNFARPAQSERDVNKLFLNSLLPALEFISDKTFYDMKDLSQPLKKVFIALGKLLWKLKDEENQELSAEDFLKIEHLRNKNSH